MVNQDLPLLDHHKYPPYGECIYCGGVSDLRIEHIVPFGLSGNLELPDSTCKNCADITSKIEMVILRGEFWAVRIFRELQSRRKHSFAPKDFPIKIVRNGVEKQIRLPVNECPILLHFPVFTAPRILTSVEKKSGVELRGVDTISFGQNPKDFLLKHKAESILTNQSQNPVAFARMIAKIAYSMAAATGALELLTSPSPIPSIILGEELAVGHWVGTIDAPNTSHSGKLHRIAIFPDERLGLLVGDVQLFCDSFAPRYSVILGHL
tara:strand:+ start:175 stop:969 length:795 start_codon:yes stop_codon:yes gene_type:complete